MNDLKEFATDEHRRRDKRATALHEASHAFVGGVLGLRIECAKLSFNPNGGLAEKHWTGSVIWQNFFDFLNLTKQEAMILRLFSLAGYVGEIVFNLSATDPPPSAFEIMDYLDVEWGTLSDTDRRAFEEHGGDATEREVEAVLHLLDVGRAIVLEIADRLEAEEILDRDTLAELLSLRVFLPYGPDLLDYKSWEIEVRDTLPDGPEL